MLPFLNSTMKTLDSCRHDVQNMLGVLPAIDHNGMDIEDYVNVDVNMDFAADGSEDSSREVSSRDGGNIDGDSLRN